MDSNQFKILESKLDIVTKLLALNLLQGKSATDQITMLSGAGLRPIEIARIMGKTDNYVNVTLNRIKKVKDKQSEADEKAQTTRESGGTTNV
jgi:DNA-binding CsgD family transcriptional regulator